MLMNPRRCTQRRCGCQYNSGANVEGHEPLHFTIGAELCCDAPEEVQTKELRMSVAAAAPTVEVAASARMQPDSS